LKEAFIFEKKPKKTSVPLATLRFHPQASIDLAARRENFATLGSVLSTAKKHAINSLEALIVPPQTLIPLLGASRAALHVLVI
jgi:hypothetical protein